MSGGSRPAATAALLQVAVNGPWTSQRHPALPIGPSDVAADAARAHRAGAGAVHLHPKTPDGHDTLDAEWVAAHVSRVRELVPTVPVGVTTGAWIEKRPGRRLDRIRAWTVLPDVASVNWHEDGAEEVAAALLERGVAVEAGLFHADAAAAWVASGSLAAACLRAMIELPDRPWASVLPELRRMLDLLDDRGTPLLVHGEGASCWGSLEFAARHGYELRIGLEDTTVLPSGATATDNEELVRAAREVAARTGRDDRENA